MTISFFILDASEKKLFFYWILWFKPHTVGPSDSYQIDKIGVVNIYLNYENNSFHP